MTYLELLTFLKSIEDDKETLNEPVRMYLGEYFFEIMLVGQLGVENGSLLFIQTEEAAATDTE